MSHRHHPGQVLPALSALSLAVCGSLQAEVPATQNDWGTVGLLQTPTARMAEEGEFAFTASHTSPYSRYSVSMQPLPWFEAAYRYVNNTAVAYGPLGGDQHFKDKSIDFKVRLWTESRWRPEVAFGARDVGGTGFFASEYLVASKRFGSVDTSIGLATGYLGSAGNLSNPLGWIDDRFDVRPGIQQAGDFNSNTMFRGPVGVFGGVAWQTPWESLLLKVEYDGHDYTRELWPGRGGVPANLRPDSRINLGLQYTPTPGVRFTVGWERGNELLASLTLRGNLKNAPRQPRWLDPPKVPMREESLQPVAGDGRALEVALASPSEFAPASEDSILGSVGPREGYPLLPGHTWDDVRGQLIDNAGFYLRRVEVNDQELILHGNQTRHFYLSEGLGRVARVVDNMVDPHLDWVTLEYNRQDMPIAQSSVSRKALASYVRGDIDLDTLSRSIELNPPGSSREGAIVYDRPLTRRLTTGLSPGLKEIIGGPDGFILYQLTANASADWMFSRSSWLSGTLSVDLLNNFDKFRYDAPSRLPRVRTDVRQYVTTSDVMVPNFQFTTTHALGRDLYGMAYAGLLESMYGGVGGEILYRPMGERWALGFDANWVKQRDYDQRFSFRDYSVATGHATLYYDLGFDRRIHVATSAGRYLAGDWGVTVDVSRIFDNGVTMGAYATKTNISAAEFGEGSFDKGIYVLVPMDLLMPRSSRATARLWWQPLVRDGGARLVKKYSLYRMTGERDQKLFFDNIEYVDP
ncbi:YjbH domain-containing protein [Pseudoxanthomonas suwonensis]